MSRVRDSEYWQFYLGIDFLAILVRLIQSFNWRLVTSGYSLDHCGIYCHQSHTFHAFDQEGPLSVHGRSVVGYRPRNFITKKTNQTIAS